MLISLYARDLISNDIIVARRNFTYTRIDSWKSEYKQPVNKGDVFIVVDVSEDENHDMSYTLLSTEEVFTWMPHWQNIEFYFEYAQNGVKSDVGSNI